MNPMKANSMRHLILAAAIAAASCGAFAQDAMKPAPMQKRDTTMQDCKDRATTAKGEKRNDTPANADTDKACADMTAKGHGKIKHDAMPKKDTGMTQEQPTK